MRILRIVYVLAVVFILIGGGLLILRAVQQPTPAPVPSDTSTDSGLVALPDGATMLAHQGTIGRQLVDWLASGEQTRTFELGGQQFVGRSAEPTPLSIGRLQRLVAMLRSYRDVDITIVGHCDATDDPAADTALGLARAQTVAHDLEAGGIGASRIAVDSRGGSQPIAGGRAANQRISIVLTHHQPT